MRDSDTAPAPPSNAPFLKDTLWYVAAGAAGVLAPTAANAQIVYTDLDPDLFVEDTEVGGDGSYTGLAVDFDGDGDSELLFMEEVDRSYTQFYWDNDPPDGSDRASGVIGTLVDNFIYPQPLSIGASIGPGPNLITLTTVGYFSYGTFTFKGASPTGWVGTDAYMGVQFTLDGTDTHYGWVRVEVPNAGGALIVKEMAYESTPDTPITAGATGTAIEPNPDATPGTHALSLAAPNPTRDRTQFTLEVAETQHVRAAVYDARGREVAALFDGPLAAGTEHRLVVGGDLPSGVYLLRVTGETFSDARPVTLLK